jgi:DNA-binding winged helix-turn-helix (wHTH) protein
MRLTFGECILDAGSRELLRRGARQELSPKAFQFLELLLGARPRALSKQEIQDKLWPDAFVSESSLPRLATEVRAAIGDDAREGHLLRTVHRFGYAFSGAVAVSEPAPAWSSACRLVMGERIMPLREGENVLGRSGEAQVCLDLARVSRQHARIVVTGRRAVLEDLDSKNGTFLRGRRVEEVAELADGDEICIGRAVLVFRSSGRDSTTQTGTVT